MIANRKASPPRSTSTDESMLFPRVSLPEKSRATGARRPGGSGRATEGGDARAEQGGVARGRGRGAAGAADEERRDRLREQRFAPPAHPDERRGDEARLDDDGGLLRAVQGVKGLGVGRAG